MSTIPGDEIVSPGCVGALKKHVVIWVASDRQVAYRLYQVAAIADELDQALALAPKNSETRTHQHTRIFIEDRLGYIQAGWFCESNQQRCSREPVGVERCGHHDIGVEYQPERKHLPLLLFGSVFLDELVDLAGSQPVCSVAFRFFTYDSQHFWLGGRKLDIISDAQEDRLRGTSLLDDKRAPFAVQKV
jgi:hypothetical protein